MAKKEETFKEKGTSKTHIKGMEHIQNIFMSFD